jgi:DNA-binding XRE family transcriptional regulator
MQDRQERISLSQKREMMYEKFRTNTRLLRAKVGVSGCEASEKMGLKNGKRLIDLEYGRAHPTLEEVMMIAEYFKVSTNDLLYGEAKIIFQ